MGNDFLDWRLSRRDALRYGLGGGLALGLAACGASGSAPPSPAASAANIVQPSFDLIKAAQKEANLTLYSASSGGGGAQVAGAFTATYGIPVNLVILSSAPQEVRFAAEVQGGKVVADILQLSDLAWITGTAVPKGWLDTPQASDIPAMNGWPQDFVKGGLAYVVTVSPLGLAYNSDKVKGSDVPKQWNDLLKPRWTGLIGMDDLRANTVDLSWLYNMQQTPEYGDAWLTKLAAQRLQISPSPQLVNSVASGDLAMYIPATWTNVSPLKVAGAPLVWFVPPGPVTGSEQYMVIAKGSPHPNAARLFFNFALSQAGQIAYCKSVCSSVANPTPEGTLSLPKGYKSPPIDAAVANRAKTLSLVGLG
jgi:ABC-type Fe3+ transport system substrate-binding protein